MALFERVHMPSFAGATEWLNSEPLGTAELRGRVVLVNFWTWTCINWLRQEPYVRAWSQAYRDDGLIVIGVHTPEFAFEHDIDGVRRASRERAIDYPVVVDNDYEIWSAFANHFWPALYFVDADGIIRDDHFGEGRYEQSERVIQRLLGVERELVSVEGVGVEAAADWDHLYTPETYLGSARSDQLPSSNGARPDDHRADERPERLPLNQWALAGTWAIEPESVVLEQPGGSIAFRFAARDAHLVLSPGAGEPIAFRVLIDGEAPGRSHGVDVDEDGNGVLSEGRMYQLVRQHDAARQRILEITFLQPGANAYAFTFGERADGLNQEIIRISHARHSGPDGEEKIDAGNLLRMRYGPDHSGFGRVALHDLDGDRKTRRTGWDFRRDAIDRVLRSCASLPSLLGLDADDEHSLFTRIVAHLHRDDIDRLHDVMRDVRSRGDARSVDVDLTTRDGAVRRLRAMATRVPNGRATA